MQLLVRPEPYEDESLESYLLRLSSANFLESYPLLSGSIREWLWENDRDAASAFPLALSQINIYHAKQSSSFRIRAIRLVESLTGLERLPLLKLAILNSSDKYGNGLSAVVRNGVFTPRCFLRSDGIPVCPHCLAESSYIRQHWHFLHYSACVEHECVLLERCPACKATLNYLDHEQIGTCTCGFELKSASVESADCDALTLSQIVVGHISNTESALSSEPSLSIRYGALLWYYLRRNKGLETDKKIEPAGLKGALEYFSRWPESLKNELQGCGDTAEQRLIAGFNKTSFQHVFGNMVLSASHFPSEHVSQNFILDEVLSFLEALVLDNPKTKRANIADVLLSVAEVAVVLATSHEQVYRLYQEGFLELSLRLPSKTKLGSHTPAFYLRQVFEFRAAHGQPSPQAQNAYLSGW
ncbi:TniQ family protein [Neptunomonas qingdaonensis]|uniref:TniQ protein n=1 Tax=Neptunomonas qingdaonensis TaxID=1045558 RepID=A0A1I2TNJ3_9GAMM|nr:TniQ family protein [Neptunomonas qingdaonensis]SFG66484.1 TniQ protein [Neptunomonas qingdaonensis]